MLSKKDKLQNTLRIWSYIGHKKSDRAVGHTNVLCLDANSPNRGGPTQKFKVTEFSWNVEKINNLCNSLHSH